MTTEFDAKRPGESEPFAFVFSRRMATGDTIVSATVKVALASDASEAAIVAMVIGSASIDVDAHTVTQVIGGGDDGQTYTVICVATTAAGYVLHECRDLPVTRDLT